MIELLAFKSPLNHSLKRHKTVSRVNIKYYVFTVDFTLTTLLELSCFLMLSSCILISIGICLIPIEGDQLISRIVKDLKHRTYSKYRRTMPLAAH